jgi:hypothetical protein
LTHSTGRFQIHELRSVQEFYERLIAQDNSRFIPSGLYSQLVSRLRQSFRTFAFLDPANPSSTINITGEFNALVIRIREAFQQNNVGVITDALRLTAPDLQDSLEDRIENFIRFIGRSEFADITWSFIERKFFLRFNFFPVPHEEDYHLTSDGHLRIVLKTKVRATTCTFTYFQGTQEQLRRDLRIIVQLPPRDNRPSPRPVSGRVQQDPLVQQDITARSNQVPPFNSQPFASQAPRRRESTHREGATRRPRRSEDRRVRERRLPSSTRP